MINKFTEFEIKNIETNFSEDYFKGASMASLGAVESLMDNLGVIRNFLELSSDEQEYYLDYCGNMLRENHRPFIKEFLKNISEK